MLYQRYLISKICREDNLKMIKKAKLKNNHNINKYFVICCLYGSYDVASWIINNFQLTKYQINHNIIYQIIKKKHLDILQLLYQKKIIDLINNNFFNYACSIDLEISQWLYSLELYDIHSNKETPLLTACINEKIEIVSWLISQLSDYEIGDDYIFLTCCKKRKINTLRYLCSICYRYSYKIEYTNNILTNMFIIKPLVLQPVTKLISENRWQELIKQEKINISEESFDYLCSITYRNSNFVTNCSHYFDFASLMRWYAIKKICPNCKRKIILNKCKIFSDYYFEQGSSPINMG